MTKQPLFRAIVILICGCSRPTATPSLPPGLTTVNAESLTIATSVERAKRRAFEGAPPVIPHQQFNMACTACHNSIGQAVPPAGIAPANPHVQTPGLSDASRCRQCHVFQKTLEDFRASTFVGLVPGNRKGERAYKGAPPTIPHCRFMHESCIACHAGPAARPELVCTHADRLNCRQCHVQSNDDVSAPIFRIWTASRVAVHGRSSAPSAR